MLIRLIVARRSTRAFSSRGIPGTDLDAIQAAASAMPTVHGMRSGRAFLVKDPLRAHGLVDALLTGIAGKANLWIGRGERPPAFVVCAGDPDRSPVRDGRHLYNVDAAMAGEAAVLAAASAGVDSVWLAAIGEREVCSYLGLVGERVNALIALGYSRRGGIYDALSQSVISGRRRPLAEMAHEGRFGIPLDVAPPDPVRRRDAIELYGRCAGRVPVTLPPPCPAFGGQPTVEEMRLVLEAARWAPNADNAQIWRWIVVRDPAGRAAALDAAGVPGASGSGDFLLVAGCAAPALIKHRTREQPFALIDLSIASVHAMAMAAALGHGWNMLVDFDYGRAGRELAVPAGHRLVVLLMLGRPAAGHHPPWQQMR